MTSPQKEDYNDRINRRFDFDDLKNRPVSNVCVPAPKYLCGMRPEDVKEPEVRAKYEKLIESNKQKGLRFNEQINLHRIDQKLDAFIEKFLINIYAVAPFDLNELKETLNAFKMAGGESKKRILEAVRKVEMGSEK